MKERKCRYCGKATKNSVWTRGTKRIFVPICQAASCWKKYYKQFPK